MNEKKRSTGHETRCSTCYGYGLWAIGDNTPMGRMDAIDGMPSSPCPECGAGGPRLSEECGA